jgi:hypothetical protein
VLLLAGGPLLDRAWARGGHGTPEQWAYHMLMMSLGLVDHHAHAVAESTETSNGVLGYEVEGVAFAAPGPSAVGSIYSMAMLGLIAAAVVVGAVWPRRLRPIESRVPIGEHLRPVDQPPRGR